MIDPPWKIVSAPLDDAANAGRLGTTASVPAVAAKNSRRVNPGRKPSIDPKTLPTQA
jgi:hypothetical protein